jgi:hypothetical protein
MRGLVFLCAGAALSIAPAWAQQAVTTDASGNRSRVAEPSAPATHKSLNPIGQALDDLLRQASRSQSQRAAHVPAAEAKNATARAGEADTPPPEASAPVEVAVH